MSDEPDDKVTFSYQGKTAEFPVVHAVDGRDSADISTFTKQTGLTALDPGFVNTASTTERDHLHRRRCRHPALPRLRDRRPREQLDLPRGRLAAHLRAAADRRRARRVLREGAPPHPAARRPQALLLGAAAHRAPDVGAVVGGLGALDLLRGLARPAQPRDGRALDHPAAGQAAGHRRLRAQEGARPGVPLPRQLAELHRELPQAQLRQPRRAVRGRPGAREGARPAADPARGPRAERLHRDRPPRRLDRAPTSSRPSRPASTPSTARCTAAPTRRCSRCSGRSATPARACSTSSTG